MFSQPQRSFLLRPGRVRNVNILAVSTAILAFVFGNIVFQMNGRVEILYAAIVEGVLFLIVPILNFYRHHEKAVLLTFFTHCISVLYFGLLIGPVAQVHMMTIFLAGVAILIFPTRTGRVSCGIMIALVLVCLELNYKFGFVQVLPLSFNNQELLRRMVVGTVIGLNCLMLYFYAEERGFNHARLFSLFKQLRAKNKELIIAKHNQEILIRETNHEIRNPLHVINGILQFYSPAFNKEDRPTEIAIPTDLLFAMYVASKDVVGKIGNIMEWSSIQAGKPKEPNQRPFNLVAWLKDMTAEYQALALVKGRSLTGIFGKLPPFIIQDAEMLSSVVGNLLSNAIKFSRPKTAISFKVGYYAPQLIVTVTDSGYGLTDAEIEKIFEPFVGGLPTDVKMQGTGLGLQIVKQIVERLGGTLKVRSRLGKGTEIKVNIPVEIADPVPEPANEQEINPFEFFGANVLLIEDNPLTRITTCLHLMKLGVNIREAESGADAILLIENNPFDLILLDWHLADMVGSEVLAHIKSMPGKSKIPVIAITGDANSDTKDKIFKAGAVAFLSKPVDFTLFIHTVKDLISKSSKEADNLYHQ